MSVQARMYRSYIYHTAMFAERRAYIVRAEGDTRCKHAQGDTGHRHAQEDTGHRHVQGLLVIGHVYDRHTDAVLHVLLRKKPGCPRQRLERDDLHAWTTASADKSGRARGLLALGHWWGLSSVLTDQSKSLAGRPEGLQIHTLPCGHGRGRMTTLGCRDRW